MARIDPISRQAYNLAYYAAKRASILAQKRAYAQTVTGKASIKRAKQTANARYPEKKRAKRYGQSSFGQWHA